MSTTTEILENLITSADKASRFAAGLFHLALLHEFRHWRALIDGMPEAAVLDGPARDRAAAAQAVDIVTRFFHDEQREQLEAQRDEMIAQLLRFAGENEKPKAGWLN